MRHSKFLSIAQELQNVYTSLHKKYKLEACELFLPLVSHNLLEEFSGVGTTHKDISSRSLLASATTKKPIVNTPTCAFRQG